jgi:hypothetical protein
MANTSKPSIFKDRRSIGSEKDLDEYGVWVKSESEEFAVSGQDTAFQVDFPPFQEEFGSTGSGTAAGTAQSGQTNSEVTLSAALLLKIAEELVTIKAELAALKSELDYMRNGGAAPVTRTPRPVTPEPPAQTPVVDNLPAAAETVEEEPLMEADFDDFDIEEPAGGEFVTDEAAEDEEPAKTGTTETGFFDADEDSDKIALTSDELDLLGEDAHESAGERADSFFTENHEQEKIAFTGDEINNILSGIEISGDVESNETAKVEEITLEDIPEEPVIESEPKTMETVSGKEPAAEDDTFDINGESIGVSLSDYEIGFDEDTFDIKDIEIEDELTEHGAETTDSFDSVALESDMETDSEGSEPIGEEPETADIAFDPFGSLPDEDMVDDDITDADISTLEDDLVDDEAPAEEPVAGDIQDEPSTTEDISGGLSATEENGVADGEDMFAGFPVPEEEAEDTPGGLSATEENCAADGEDIFTGFPAVEESAFDQIFDELTAAETARTAEIFPDNEISAGEAAEEDTTHEAAFEDSPESPEVAGIESDPELSKLLDEDLRQTVPAPEDTSYLDDEKPLEFDEAAEPETPPTPSAPAPVPQERPDTVSSGSGEESSVLKGVPQEFKQELRTVLSYMDILLESLPEEKIEEFARSEHFEPYKKLFKELGLV